MRAGRASHSSLSAASALVVDAAPKETQRLETAP